MVDIDYTNNSVTLVRPNESLFDQDNYIYDLTKIEIAG
jgi:hypothetical protein